MKIPLCIKRSDWPLIDQLHYREAREITSFLGGPKPAQKWSAARCRNVEQGYGQWLSFLARNGWLDTEMPPETRVNFERVRIFAIQLQKRVSSCSAAMVFEGFARLILVMAPNQDWNWLRVIITNLKTIARPEKDKRGHMVDARQLLALGVDLMNQALDMGRRYHAATLMRDGLMIAMLISDPIRIGNLTAITIGDQLWFDGNRYRLSFNQDETKNRHAHDSEMPLALNPYIDTWLRDHRRRLLAHSDGTTTNRLWIDRWGKPMGERAIRDQIEKRTREAFGRHVWPHLMRSIAATSFVDHDPAKVGLVPDLLGHANYQTAHKYYVLANGTRAHTAVQLVFEAKRAAALTRFREQKGSRHGE